MATGAKQQGKHSALRVFTQPRMMALLLLGFSSGMPLYLMTRTLQAWMTVEKVDLSTIGFFSLAALPVSLKFLWAPVLDRYVPPFLGRRRGWLLITQVLLLIAIAAMGLHDPRAGLAMLAINTVGIAFLSASQDIVGDAYRTDLLEERAMGAGSAVWVLGYRIALLVTGSLAFVLADHIGWRITYVLMSLLMLVGIVTDFFAPEPTGEDRPPASLYEAVWLPFRDFFTRAGAPTAIAILIFIILFKLPDNLAIGMSTPFLLKIGFSETEIGTVVGAVGLFATIVGSLFGGGVVEKMGLNRSLWVVLAVQALSQIGYLALALHGHDFPFMVAAVVAENFVYGMVTTVFIAYLMSLCSKRFSATQYALLSSLMAVSRDLIISPAGALAEATGWAGFFTIALISGIPALLMLPWLAPWRGESPVGAAEHSGEVEEE
ncbi:MAG TPA: AmpG family muropeptide MFS transporter [Longimicrobiaceae bacterium]|nr:AmpG family muropeptide MFS transporter [Longimicrobiaceae bacterium]